MRRFLELMIPMLWRLVGGGDQNGRAVKVPVSGTDVIKVSFQSASSTDTRILIVADSAGN